MTKDYYDRNVNTNVEKICWRLWLIHVVCFSILVFAVFLNSFVALAPHAGFPCLFIHMGNFIASRNTSPSTDGQPTPEYAVFLNSSSVGFLVYFDMIMWCLIASYVVVGAFYVKKKTCMRPRTTSEFAIAIAPTSTLMAGMVGTWAFQLFVQMMAFRQIALSAVAYGIYFIALAVFCLRFLTTGKSYSKYIEFNHHLRSACPPLYRLMVHFKAVVVNLMFVSLGINILTLSLFGETVLVINFWVRPSVALIGATVVFFIIGFMFITFIELGASRYIHVLIGPHTGLIIACGIAGTTTITYSANVSHILHSNWLSITAGTLGTFATIVLLMLILRVYRAYRFHSSHNTEFGRKTKDAIRSMKYKINDGYEKLKKQRKEAKQAKRAERIKRANEAIRQQSADQNAKYAAVSRSRSNSMDSTTYEPVFDSLSRSSSFTSNSSFTSDTDSEIDHLYETPYTPSNDRSDDEASLSGMSTASGSSERTLRSQLKSALKKASRL